MNPKKAKLTIITVIEAGPNSGLAHEPKKNEKLTIIIVIKVMQADKIYVYGHVHMYCSTCRLYIASALYNMKELLSCAGSDST